MTPDVLVVGLGGVGSAAAHHLAKRGAKVLGLDPFPAAHERGSSHGQTRVIRLAYFEHADYVPMLRRAFELWRELEQARGESLYRETGLIEIGPPNGEVVPGVLVAAKRWELEVEKLTGREVEKRFPGFRVPDDMSAVFEKRAGFLRVEACVRAHLAEAARLGAELKFGESVLKWGADGDSVVVETDRGKHSAGALVIAPGPWAPKLLADLDLPLEVKRKPVFWFKGGPKYEADGGAPVYLYETKNGVFYGIPGADGKGLKCAEHTGGRTVTDPLEVDRTLDPADLARVDKFLETNLPWADRTLQTHNVCLYTMTPDQNFIVDRHPQHPKVAFAAGLSGHGFKFAAVLGEILADLALEGSTRHPIDFLSLRRFSPGS